MDEAGEAVGGDGRGIEEGMSRVEGYDNVGEGMEKPCGLGGWDGAPCETCKRQKARVRLVE